MGRFDWERVRLENLVSERGAETARAEKVGDWLARAKCVHCGVVLRDGSVTTEKNHLRKCKKYIPPKPTNREVRAIRLPKRITSFLKSRHFPQCLMNRELITPGFTGKVISVQEDVDRITLQNGEGVTKVFDIDWLIKTERRRFRRPANSETAKSTTACKTTKTEKTQTPFLCPYCGQALPGSSVEQRQHTKSCGLTKETCKHCAKMIYRHQLSKHEEVYCRGRVAAPNIKLVHPTEPQRETDALTQDIDRIIIKKLRRRG